MIVAVSLRLLNLIFRQMLGPVMLMGRSSFTNDVELLVLRHEAPQELIEERAARPSGSRSCSKTPGSVGLGRVRHPRGLGPTYAGSVDRGVRDVAALAELARYRPVR
jgi:hypothetical protein